MKKIRKQLLCVSVTLLASSTLYADHEQTPNYDSASAILSIPAIRLDQNPNGELTNLSLVLTGADNVIFSNPDSNGVPDYQTIRVNLSPAQQTTADVMTAGSCRGIARVVHSSRFLEAALACDNIDIAAAHIHNAPAGSNGSILFHMEFDSSVAPGGTENGSLVQLSRHDCTARTDPGAAQAPGSCLNNGVSGRTQMSESEYTDFMAGNFYFNVHTAANPAGELRGQITPARRITAAVQCSQSEAEIAQVSVVAENNAAGDDFATCSGSVSVDLSTLEISVNLVPSVNATVNAAHIHERPDSETLSGPVIVNLEDDGNGNFVPASGTLLTESQLSSLVSGLLYFNIHTDANPAGTTRAQILPALE